MEEDQRRIMGAGRFELWKQGTDLRSMVYLKESPIWGGQPAVKTLDEIRMSSYKVGKPIEPTEKTYEMALNPVYYANTIARKYGINLKAGGKQVGILFDGNMPQIGKTKASDPYHIYVGKLAFVSESELANTIVHELHHARMMVRYEYLDEPSAYAAGDALSEYIAGRR